MTCKCLNHDGTSSEICFGTCRLESMIVEQDKQQQRDPLNGFAELILSQVDKIIDRRIMQCRVEFEKSQIALYKTAFLEGIKEGMKLKECDEEHY